MLGIGGVWIAGRNMGLRCCYRCWCRGRNSSLLAVPAAVGAAAFASAVSAAGFAELVEVSSPAVVEQPAGSGAVASAAIAEAVVNVIGIQGCTVLLGGEVSLHPAAAWHCHSSSPFPGSLQKT